MNHSATRRRGRVLAGLTILLMVCSTNTRAQRPASERSSVFDPALEESIQSALTSFRFENLPGFGVHTIEEAQQQHLDDYARDEQLLSLNLFRSLHAYNRGLSDRAQSIADYTLSNASPSSRTSANIALASALEFYAHSPLRRSDVQAGLARLQSISNVGATTSSVQSEIYFWRAEGHRSLGELAAAEMEYRSALAHGSDARLTALTQFRLGELFERGERYSTADSAFASASHVPQSPLMLLATLRRAGVERAEKKYRQLLATLDSANVLFHSTEHLIRTSARDLQYSSPLIDEVMQRNAKEEQDMKPVAQLITPFFEGEIALLLGSALSELGEYAHATEVLKQGETLVEGIPESVSNTPTTKDQARFVADALHFEEAWSLFQQAKYKEAAGAFLQLGVNDSIRRQRLRIESPAALREQGRYYDPFLNDSTSGTSPANIDRSVLSKEDVDTTIFLYNDFAERARFYAGIALARAGMLTEASDVLLKPTLDKSMLYSDRAQYQLALIRFAQHSYEALKLLEPIAYEQSTRGAYASFLLGELSYRKKFYEKAVGYFLNSYANLPLDDTATRASAHLERGLSLIPLGNWAEASDELHTFLLASNRTELGKTDEALYWLGKSYFRSKQYDSSRAVLTKLLRDFPASERSVDAQYAYAWSLFATDDFKDAEPAFEKVISLDSITRFSYDALARAGDAYYAIGNYPNASIIYNQAVDRPAFNDYRTTRANMMLGLTRVRLDSGRSAMNGFNYITSKYPKSDIVDQAYFDKALAAYSINQSQSAEQSIEKLISLYHASPLAPRGLFVAGEERVRHNDLLGATTFYRRVVNDYPFAQEAGRSLVALQDALVQLKRAPEALAIADTFVSKHPDHPLRASIILHSGELKLQVGDAHNALGSFQAFLKDYPASPDRPQAELGIARAMVASKDTANALIQLQNFIAKYDTLDIASAAYLERARIERSKKLTDSTAKDFQAAFAPQYFSSDAAPQAMFEYGQLLADAKRTDSAVTAFVDLSTRYPIEASISARGALRAGELLASKGRYNEARYQFERIIKAHPSDVWGGAAQVRIGEGYLASEDAKQAASTFTAARENWTLSGDASSRALYGLARSNARLGRKAEAIRNLHALLEMRGLTEEMKDNANALLTELQPPKAKKKKGRSAE